MKLLEWFSSKFILFFCSIFICLITFTHLFKEFVTDLNRGRLSFIVTWLVSKFRYCGVRQHGIIIFFSSPLDSRAIIIQSFIFYSHYYCVKIHSIIIFYYCCHRFPMTGSWPRRRTIWPTVASTSNCGKCACPCARSTPTWRTWGASLRSAAPSCTSL